MEIASVIPLRTVTKSKFIQITQFKLTSVGRALKLIHICCEFHQSKSFHTETYEDKNFADKDYTDDNTGTHQCSFGLHWSLHENNFHCEDSKGPDLFMHLKGVDFEFNAIHSRHILQ